MVIMMVAYHTNSLLFNLCDDDEFQNWPKTRIFVSMIPCWLWLVGFSRNLLVVFHSPNSALKVNCWMLSWLVWSHQEVFLSAPFPALCHRTRSKVWLILHRTWRITRFTYSLVLRYVVIWFWQWNFTDLLHFSSILFCRNYEHFSAPSLNTW